MRIVLTMLLLLASLAAHAQPVPSDVKIVPPDQDVPSGMHTFVGKWGPARWDGKLDHILVIESVDVQGNATAVYSYGAFAGWNIPSPGWQRLRGRIEGRDLKFPRARDGSVVAYRLNDDGTLSGRYEVNRQVATIVLKKSE